MVRITSHAVFPLTGVGYYVQLGRRFLVGDVMTTDIVSLTPVIRLDTLVRILEDTRYNGFPVVESFDDPADDGKGSRFLGIIVRHQVGS